MLTTGTVEIQLPTVLIERLSSIADVNYSTIQELLRRIVTDYCIALDRKPLVDEVSSTRTIQDETSRGPQSSEGGYHTRDGKTRKFKGIVLNGKRWRAQITRDGKFCNLGTFNNPEDAARAYDNELIRLAGGDLKAAVNFQPEPSRIDPFVAKLAMGEQLTSEEWKAWYQQKDETPELNAAWEEWRMKTGWKPSLETPAPRPQIKTRLALVDTEADTTTEADVDAHADDPAVLEALRSARDPSDDG